MAMPSVAPRARARPCRWPAARARRRSAALAALAALAVFARLAAFAGLAAFGAPGLGGPTWDQEHEERQGENGEDEEVLVLDQRPDHRHRRLVGRQPARLRQLVVAVQEQLGEEDEEGDAGDLEEAPEVDPDAAADEEHPEDDRRGEPDHRAQKGEQAGRRQRKSGEEEDGLDPLAKDHEEGEEEEPDGDRPATPSALPGEDAGERPLHLAGELVRVAPHPDQESSDEDRRGDIEEALEHLLVHRHPVEEEGARQGGGGGRGDPRPDGAQIALRPLFAQKGDDDPHHEGRLHPLAEGDDQRLKHGPLPGAPEPLAAPLLPSSPQRSRCTGRRS